MIKLSKLENLFIQIETAKKEKVQASFLMGNIFDRDKPFFGGKQANLEARVIISMLSKSHGLPDLNLEANQIESCWFTKFFYQ